MFSFLSSQNLNIAYSTFNYVQSILIYFKPVTSLAVHFPCLCKAFSWIGLSIVSPVCAKLTKPSIPRDLRLHMEPVGVATH